jgi:hypothetical protein
MPQRTNPFQNLSASIMAILHMPDYLVEESILEVNPQTNIPREIDIRITEIKNPNNKIMVECRDWKRKQDIIWIDQLDGKARSLNFKRVIAVSSSGFHETTIKEAKSRGIETMHITDAESIDINNWLFRINEFGLNIDFEPIVSKISLISPKNIKSPDLSKIEQSDILLLNLKDKKKISLLDFVKGVIKDHKIIEYVRTNNTDEAINHYNYDIPCDSGCGYSIDNKNFIPLVSIIFSVDSARRAYKIPIKHMRAGEHKILVGEVDNHNRLVLEEKEGKLTVMIESRIEN